MKLRVGDSHALLLLPKSPDAAPAPAPTVEGPTLVAACYGAPLHIPTVVKGVRAHVHTIDDGGVVRNKYPPGMAWSLNNSRSAGAREVPYVDVYGQPPQPAEMLKLLPSFHTMHASQQTAATAATAATAELHRVIIMFLDNLMPVEIRPLLEAMHEQSASLDKLRIHVHLIVNSAIKPQFEQVLQSDHLRGSAIVAFLMVSETVDALNAALVEKYGWHTPSLASVPRRTIVSVPHSIFAVGCDAIALGEWRESRTEGSTGVSTVTAAASALLTIDGDDAEFTEPPEDVQQSIDYIRLGIEAATSRAKAAEFLLMPHALSTSADASAINLVAQKLFKCIKAKYPIQTPAQFAVQAAAVQFPGAGLYPNSGGAGGGGGGGMVYGVSRGATSAF